MTSYSRATAGPSASPGQPSSRLRSDLRVHRRVNGPHVEIWINDPLNSRVVRTSEADYHRIAFATTHEPNAAHATAVSDTANVDTPANIAAASSSWLAAARHGLLRRLPGQAFHPARTTTAPSRWWKQPLYIRFPGIPADPLANWLARHTGWLFSSTAVVIWVAFLLTSLAFLLPHTRSLWQEAKYLPTFQLQYWPYALLVLATTKVIHECAHAATCRRAGASCREVGLLLLCGTPCLYCDVSDSWRVASRWKRMAIMAAGVYVEWIIAACALWGWLLADSLTIRVACLHVVFICGLSTFVFNANPLMRYDGYFVLSDYFNLSNLRQRSRDTFQRLTLKILAAPVPTGAANDHHRSSLAAQFALVFYHLASRCYQTVVMVALGGWAFWMLGRLGLEPLARVLLIFVAGLVTLRSLEKGLLMLRGKGIWKPVPTWRRTSLLFGGLALASACLLIPYQPRITASGRVDWADAQPIYLPYNATVREHLVSTGDHVVAEQPIMRVATPDVEISLVRAAGRLAEANKRWEAAVSQAVQQPDTLRQVEVLKTARNSAAADLQHWQTMRVRGLIQSPKTGTILPLSGSRFTADGPVAIPGNPTSTHGTNGQSRNDAQPAAWQAALPPLGSTLPAGTPCCLVGSADEKHVLLTVDAQQRRAFTVGAPIRLRLEHSSKVVESQILAIELSADRARPKPNSPSPSLDNSGQFQIICELPSEIARQTMPGTHVTAVARDAPTNAWTKLHDWLSGATW